MIISSPLTSLLSAVSIKYCLQVFTNFFEIVLVTVLQFIDVIKKLEVFTMVFHLLKPFFQ